MTDPKPRPTTESPAALQLSLDDVRHVRIVLLTGLGDVIHGLPIANAIKRALPHATITWVVEPMPAGMLERHPAIDGVVVFHKKRGWDGVRQLRRELSQTPKPDVTLNFNIYFKSVFPTVLSPAPVRLGFDRARARDGVWLFHSHHLEPRPRAHTQDMFLEFLDALGIAREPVEWRLAPTPDEAAAAREAMRTLLNAGENAVALVTATANPKKDWFADRWTALAERLYHDFALRPVVLGGPGARESAIAAHVTRHANAPVIDARGDGVRRLAWLLRECRLLIAPDTGPVHIARALDVPVIGLYGHSNPWRVGPWRRYEDLWVDRYTDGEPDPATFEPKLGRMERITVDDVLERVAHALDRYPAPAQAPPASGPAHATNTSTPAAHAPDAPAGRHGATPGPAGDARP